MQTPAPGPADTTDQAHRLRRFRAGFHSCLTGWADAAFELTDAALCAPGPVSSVPGLSLEPVFRRSHGSLYKALARGGVDPDAVRDLLAAHRPPDWPLVFAMDASTWARCAAETSPQRGYYYSASKHWAGKPIVAGWSYQWLTQLGWANDSWTAPMDARRIAPTQDTVAVTTDQVRDLLARLGPSVTTPMFVFDAGYDPIALTHELADQDATIVVRIRDNRVFHTDPAPPTPDTRGRSRRHGQRVKLTDPDTWPEPDHQSSSTDSRYGTVTVTAWHGLHPKLGRRGHWAGHEQPPIVAVTVIRVQVQHLPKPTSRIKKTLWLWVAGLEPDLEVAWRAYLRWFDIEEVSGSSRTPWAGPRPRCAPRNRPTGGPGSCSPRTPSCAWPDPSCRTSACPGNEHGNPAGSPRPGSDADFVDLPQP